MKKGYPFVCDHLYIHVQLETGEHIKETLWCVKRELSIVDMLRFLCTPTLVFFISIPRRVVLVYTYVTIGNES